METKRGLDNKAKILVKSSPDEALKLYKQIWEAFPEEFNAWDAFYTLQAMKGAKSPSLKWAKELVEKFPEEKVGNMYAWVIFQHGVKGKDAQQIKSMEHYIADLPQYSRQKDLSQADDFPCPTTLSVMKLCEAHAENLFNANRINELLSLIDPEKLSPRTKPFKTEDGKEVTPSSDLEKYFSMKTKALLKLEKFDECKELSQRALSTLKEFHYNNDLWLKMRIAICEEGQGNYEESEVLFVELLSSKAGSDKWFLYRDISEVYFEQGDYVKAWKYAVDATFYGNEPGFMIKLYLHQAKTLFKLNRAPEGKLMAELIASILKEEGWREKQEYSKLFSFYQLNPEEARPMRDVLSEAKGFWARERYGNQALVKGEVIKIHGNKKSGFIKAENGHKLSFGKKDFVKKQRDLESLVGAKVKFYAMNAIDGKQVAEQIEILNMPEKKKIALKEYPTEPFSGTVKNVAKFGVFVKVPGHRDGLLHISRIPNDLKINLERHFTAGKSIQVKIQKVTDKGIELQLVEKL